MARFSWEGLIQEDTRSCSHIWEPVPAGSKRDSVPAQRFCCNLCRTMVDQISSRQSVEDSMLEQVYVPQRKLQRELNLKQAPRRSCSPWRSPQRSRFSGRNSVPWGTHTLPEKLQSKINTGEVCEGLYSVAETQRYSRRKVWGGRSSGDELLHCLSLGEQRRVMIEAEFAKKGGGQWRWF